MSKPYFWDDYAPTWLPTSVSVKPCVKCGACCRISACPYGVWDAQRHQCSFLTKDNLCSKYNEIIKIPGSKFCPAFGEGCCSPLFNQDRIKKINNKGGAYVTSN
jgi:hypothetical protein